MSADIFHALNDLGFSLPPGVVAHWVGEARQGTDDQNLDKTPESVATTKTLAANAVHLSEPLEGALSPPS
ncbi:hypothetical protein [Streptomyces sp. NPDC091219]|uniref:hypothetical protein n=1 Tax=Streptomyces sp. NPDC091219 TaxID=3155193 RepID=UPI003450E421